MPFSASPTAPNANPRPTTSPALALWQLNRRREAETFFLDILKHSPQGFRGHALNARNRLLRLYGLERRKEAFLSLVRDTISVVSKFDRRDYLFMRMRLEFEVAVPEADRRVLEAMLAADPDDPNALAGLGSVCILENKLDDAESLFMKAISLAPTPTPNSASALSTRSFSNPTRLRSCGRCSPRTFPVPSPDLAPHIFSASWPSVGDFEAAARRYSLASRHRSRYEYPYKLSQVLHRLGRHAEAKIRELDRDRIQKARSNLRTAWNAFADAFESGPSRVEPSMLLNLALALQRLGWTVDARSWYFETLLDDPENKEAREGLKRLNKQTN